MKKTFTFLVTSNSQGQTKSYTLSSALVKFSLFLAVIALVFVVAIFVDYLGLLLESGENKRLKAENRILRQRFEVVENNVKSLENSLERVKGFSTKLRLITDIDSKDRNLELALGKSANSSENLPQNIEGNSSDGEDLHDNPGQVLLGEKPSDERIGELLKLELSNYKTLSIRVKQELKNSKLQEQGVLDLYSKLSKLSTLVRSTPTIKPTKGWYTAKFGYREDPFSGKPSMHQGVEIAAPEGTPVVAPADGVVSYVGYKNTDGKVLVIDHGYGLKTYYSHNSQIFVEVGQKVKRSEMVAAVGSTGRSQSSHLYYEVRVHDVPVDPLNYILE